MNIAKSERGDLTKRICREAEMEKSRVLESDEILEYSKSEAP